MGSINPIDHLENIAFLQRKFFANIRFVVDVEDRMEVRGSMLALVVGLVAIGGPSLAVAAPDLTIEITSLSPSSVAAGSSLTISYRVRNIGTTSASSSAAKFYLSGNSSLGSDSYLSPSDPVGTLCANCSATGTVTRTIPSTTSTGTWYIIGQADAFDVLAESNETNNTGYRSFSVTGSGTSPDLVVESPGVSDSSLSPGDSFTVSATVRNQGTGTADSTTLRYYRSTNSTISSSDTEIGTDYVSSLSSGSTSYESASVTAPTTEGTYWIGACVDSVTGESSTSNNCSSGLQVTVSQTGAPDLVVENPGVSDTTLAPGQSFTASATVRNQGNAASDSTTVRYYQSTNSTISTSDTELGTDGVTGLSPGSTSPESGGVVAPASTGTYWVGACVDSVAGESNTSNNCSTGVQVTVAAATAPDLTIGVTSLPTSAAPGASISISYRVSNIGTASSGANAFKLFLSNDASLDGGDSNLTPSESVGTLPAGGSVSGSTSRVLPSVANGTWYIIAQVDAFDAVAESNEANNTGSRSFTISAGTPDLVVDSPSVSNATPEPGGTFNISATVRNAGTGASGATTLTYYRSTNSTISSGDVQLATDGVVDLAAGGTSPEVATVTAPASEGTWWVGACVDSVPGEVISTNNCSAGVQIDVPPAGVPDLVVENPAVSDATLTPGQVFTASATVRNTGDGNAGSTSLRYYRSTNSTISSGDTAIGTDAVVALSPGATSSESLATSAPASLGTWWIGACVDQVSGESNTANNCSAGVQIEVASTAAETPCLILVHGTREADFGLLFMDSFESGTATNWTVPVNWANSWSLGYRYWQESVGLTSWVPWVQNIDTITLSDSESLIPWATNNQAVPHFVVRWDGAAKWWDEEASGRVAEQIIRATNGEWDEPGDLEHRSRCASAYPDGRFWVVAHSGAANVIDFILGNASSSDLYYNYNGAFDVVAERVERVISVGGAHRGTVIADQICEGETYLGATSYFCGIVDRGLCTEARQWLQTDSAYQVGTYSSAPARPVWLTGGYSGGGSTCSAWLHGQDDGVLAFSSQYACSDISASFDMSNVCGNGAKMGNLNLLNLDAGEENHAEEKNNETTFNDRSRKAIPDSPWLCSGTSCASNSTVCSDLSFANLLGYLADPVGNPFSSAEHDSCENLLQDLSTMEASQGARVVSSTELPASVVVIPTTAGGLAHDRVLDRLRPNPRVWMDGDGNRVVVEPSAWVVTPDDRVRFRVRSVGDTAITGGTFELKVTRAGMAPLVRTAQTIRKEANGALLDVPPVAPRQLVSGDEARQVQLSYEVRAVDGQSRIDGTLVVVRPILQDLRLGDLAVSRDGLTLHLTGTALRDGMVHVQGSVYARDGALIRIAQTRQKVDKGFVDIPLYLGETVDDQVLDSVLRYVSVTDVTEMPNAPQPLIELNTPIH